ncbi:hypothetical protein [Helicobacter sp. 11S02596-1]|uniref:hypothetical protein n=1 Tax=Helicobacter sp. 11S02596-1 TaxID=1476194 RepID=UPI000BA68859|nr:hypothetical protein [Helicobacter sp. 11S02596-1]PAF41073.1 hypothetical protein BJI48_09110 [Helicobacter sp. 11S02596-1]
MTKECATLPITPQDFIADLLIQKNTLTPRMLQKVREMLERLEPMLRNDFYDALMSDPLNKMRNGTITLAYFCGYFDIFYKKQLSHIIEQEYIAYKQNKPLRYGNKKTIMWLKSQPCFDESLDVKSHIREQVYKKAYALLGAINECGG